MTYLLQQAISAVQTPKADQDMIASVIMAELADEERWKSRFNETQPQLAGGATGAGVLSGGVKGCDKDSTPLQS
ncbi:MAG: hypothetical protein WCB27_11515 [Thermoguttaceae bacterium]|jgi:hypothetical protein